MHVELQRYKRGNPFTDLIRVMPDRLFPSPQRQSYQA